MPLGTVTYNLFRSDVVGRCSPGWRTRAAPVGYRTIDTTALAEGHAHDRVGGDRRPGASKGIGSRFFSVANSADAQAAVFGKVPSSASATSESIEAEAAVEPVQPATPIAVVAGPDSGRRVASLAETPAADVPVVAQRGEGPLRRVQSSDEGARDHVEGARAPRADARRRDCGVRRDVGGLLVTEDKLGDLPVGSAIDPTGTFYWQPGPGFVGTFELLFVRTACDGNKERLPVTIKIQTQ